MSGLIITSEILHVKGGYIVKLRWPYGGSPGGYGEVVALTMNEVLDLIVKADVDPVWKLAGDSRDGQTRTEVLEKTLRGCREFMNKVLEAHAGDPDTSEVPTLTEAVSSSLEHLDAYSEYVATVLEVGSSFK